MHPRSVVTVGNFDGVHAGHRALVARARALADAHHARVVVLSFDPHPLTRLRPEAAPEPIGGFARRAALLRAAGADDVERLEPTPELLARTPEAFVNWIVERFAPIAWVEGPDFRFGKARAGDVRTLAALGQARPEHERFETHIVDPVEAILSDDTIVTASSSFARWLIAQGRMPDAARVLTRPHELVGTIEPGHRRGRTIGYPTANLRTDDLPPGDGVYAGVAEVLPAMPPADGWGHGRRLVAAVSVGTNPTFEGRRRTVEAFLLDVGGAGQNEAGWTPIDGLGEYGWAMRLELHAWVREQAKFPTVDRLLAQMDRDCARVRRLIERRNETAEATA
ncbi:MAG: bifunctional riboflavin kinase/FAD synthetase [Phycisphaerales bacterium]|nr:MAG: bifunctional riboflavin kinase/FAD synthetase [Phycisphaerales bacterium]